MEQLSKWRGRVSSMTNNRYYVGDKIELKSKVWINDSVGSEVVLFNDKQEDRLYRADRIEERALHLELITELEPKIPEFDIYFCFVPSTPEVNKRILASGTQLGVKHFIPLRVPKARSIKISAETVIKMAELSGRSDIPRVREPVSIRAVIEELQGNNMFVISKDKVDSTSSFDAMDPSKALVLFIGPEEGWDTVSLELFKQKHLSHLVVSEFHTDMLVESIVAVTKLKELVIFNNKEIKNELR